MKNQGIIYLSNLNKPGKYGTKYCHGCRNRTMKLLQGTNISNGWLEKQRENLQELWDTNDLYGNFVCLMDWEKYKDILEEEKTMRGSSLVGKEIVYDVCV